MRQKLRTELWHIPGNENLESALLAFYEGYRQSVILKYLFDKERILILGDELGEKAVLAYRDKAERCPNLDEDEKLQYVRMLCEGEVLIKLGYIFNPPDFSKIESGTWKRVVEADHLTVIGFFIFLKKRPLMSYVAVHTWRI